MGDPRRHPAYSRGEGLTPENLERVDRLARRTERVSVEGMDADFDDAGLSLRNSTQPGFWARLTDLHATDPLYSWVEVTRVSGPAAAYVDLDGGLFGGHDGSGAGALRETNDRRDAPTGTSTGEVVWVTLADDGDTFEFRFGGIAEPTPLTAREVDGSPSVSPVTVLEFDQATGAKITDRTGGVARYENVDASETQVGVVNIGTQRFAGRKYLATYLQVEGGVLALKPDAGSFATIQYGNDPDLHGSTAVLTFGPGTISLESFQSVGASTHHTLYVNYNSIEFNGPVAGYPTVTYSGGSGVPTVTGQTTVVAGLSFVSGGLVDASGFAVPGSSLTGTINGGTW